MIKPDLNALFESGIKRGQDTAAKLKELSVPAVKNQEEAPTLVAEEEKSNIQKLFDLASGNASDKIFNICDWENSERLLAGFILETSETQYDAKGQRYWPSIEVVVNPDSKGNTFKVTLESEAKDPQIAESVSLNDAAEMVAFYIGSNQP